MLLDGIVIVLAVVLNPRAKRRRAKAIVEEGGDAGREDTVQAMIMEESGAGSNAEPKKSLPQVSECEVIITSTS